MMRHINLDGLTHEVRPFMFGLTACGLVVTLENPHGMNRNPNGGRRRVPCKRCARTAS